MDKLIQSHLQNSSVEAFCSALVLFQLDSERIEKVRNALKSKGIIIELKCPDENTTDKIAELLNHFSWSDFVQENNVIDIYPINYNGKLQYDTILIQKPFDTSYIVPYNRIKTALYWLKESHKEYWNAKSVYDLP